MIDLRALMLTLLVAALLPWGAWRGVYVSDHADGPAAIAAAEAPAEIRSADRCRGPSLPGSPCAHVLLPPAGAALLPAALVGRPLAPGGPDRRTGIAPPGALDPPRPA